MKEVEGDGEVNMMDGDLPDAPQPQPQQPLEQSASAPLTPENNDTAVRKRLLRYGNREEGPLVKRRPLDTPGRGGEGRRASLTIESAKTLEVDTATPHPPVDEGDSPGDPTITAQIEAGALRIFDYMPINMMVNINSVELLDYDHAARETEVGHVSGMRYRFFGNGYLSSAGTITITVTDKRFLQNRESFLDSGRRLHLRSKGFDGGHKKEGLVQAQALAKTPEEREGLTWVPAQVYLRPDGLPTSNFVIIGVGANLNVLNSTVGKT